MIVALLGRRVDADGATIERFPLRNVAMVRERIRDALVAEQAETLVVSAACGADLLALDVGREVRLRRRIILPYDREQFRVTSVIDRPGDWGPLFDSICDEVEAQNDLVVLDVMETPRERRMRVGPAILDDALALSRSAESGRADACQNVRAFVVWEGQARGAHDYTAAFAQQARELSIPIVEIRTL